MKARYRTEARRLSSLILVLPYHYLKARNLSVFYAPTSEAQPFLTGRNQSEAFYDVFAIKSRYVALFVSEDYIRKEIPMEEANIALSEHKNTGSIMVP